MNWLSRLVAGRKEPKKDEPGGAAPDAAGMLIRKEIQNNLELLKFLSTCGTFNLEKCRSFMALSAQLGKPLDASAVRQLENANQMIGGYEKLRVDILIPTLLKSWGIFFKLLADMRPDPGAVQFLKEATRQFDAVGEQLRRKSA